MNKIGVILSVYNAENYLKACIESVLNQTFKEFKFYIIDDCSTDNSFEIINSFNDERIEVIRNSKNLGLTKSLNKVIKNVEENYIARIDADDICLPQRFKTQYQFLEDHRDICLVGSSAISINSLGEKVGEIHVDVDYLKERLFFKNSLIHSSVMIRSDVMKEFFYDESIKYAQDYNLWVRISHKYKISNINLPLIKYRIHSESVTFLKKEEQLKNVLKTIGINIFKLTSNEIVKNKLAKTHFGYFFKNKKSLTFYNQCNLILKYRLMYFLNKRSKVFVDYFNDEINKLIKKETSLLKLQVKKKLGI